MPSFRVKYRPQAVKAVRDAFAVNIMQLGKQVHKRAVAECPVDSGDLKRSMFVVPDPRTIRIVVGASMPYASFVHGGTYKQKANPWLQRALDAEIATFSFHT